MNNPIDTSEDLPDILADIKGVILDCGSLQQDQIQQMWSLDASQYQLVKESLGNDSELAPGPKGVGGFRVRKKVGERLPAENVGTHEGFSTKWEAGAVDRLVELLGHKELEDLLGELAYTVRRSRMAMTGENRRGTKRELASALIIQHGNDLFRNKDIRRVVAQKCGTKPPQKWTPGKDAAIQFVLATDFPLVFAGAPSEETRPDCEFIEGKVDLAPLQEFQREVGKKMLSKLRERQSRAILTLPTGAGKTRVAVDSIRDWLASHWSDASTGLGNTVLWLAHTEELCEQAYMCFRDVWQASSHVSPLWLFRFWGNYTRDLLRHQKTLVNLHVHPAVLVSTPQRIVNLYNKRMQGSEGVVKILRKTVGVLVIDEAHRAAAPMYREILDHATQTSGLVVIGLTATPFRGEYSRQNPEAGTKELKNLFQEIIEPIETLGEEPHRELQRRGFLAEPIWDTIKTNTAQKFPGEFDLDNLGLDDIDRIDYALKTRADNADRRMAVLEHILPICREDGTQMIYFGPSVLDAECMTFLLRQRSVASAFISGTTRDVTRRRIINDFKEGRVKVLCNCEVLTTGFDAPKVTHVVMARPTVSQVMYEQMLGRGLRGPKFGGTAQCVVIDCEDNYREGKKPILGYEAFRDVWKTRKIEHHLRGQGWY